MSIKTQNIAKSDVAQLVECLLNMNEALGSILSPERKGGVWLHIYNTNTWEVEMGG